MSSKATWKVAVAQRQMRPIWTVRKVKITDHSGALPSHECYFEESWYYLIINGCNSGFDFSPPEECFVTPINHAHSVERREKMLDTSMSYVRCFLAYQVSHQRYCGSSRHELPFRNVAQVTWGVRLASLTPV